MRPLCLVVLTLLACSNTTDSGDGDPPGEQGIRLQEVAGGLSNPLYLTAPAGDPRLFVVEQPGRIRIVEDGRLLDEPFLDITDRVRSGGEQGLLSMAFHPEYAENGYFFVDYTDLAGNTRVERYRVSAADPNRADPGSATRVLGVDQPYANHNGGHVLFGPDGMLYIGMGDGGSGGDPHGHGQNPGTLLGALLRIDVDAGDPYAVPPDNPYAGGGGRGEVWAIGVRNPWRLAFDREAGLLYVADVGQSQWEEVNVVPAGEAGVNYGWNVMEGTHCYGAATCDREGPVLPVLEYDHSQGCSITGGYVYRGDAVPALRGHYLYSDYCEGWIRSFRYSGGEAVDRRDWEVGEVGSVLSLGEDAAGELYVLSANGRVYRIVAG